MPSVRMGAQNRLTESKRRTRKGGVVRGLRDGGMGREWHLEFTEAHLLGEDRGDQTGHLVQREVLCTQVPTRGVWLGYGLGLG